jgi:hypothetical protein
MKSRTLVTEVEVFATCFVGEFTAREQRWSRLFEQLSPIYKWVPGGLRKVQSCPRRRAALAVDRPTRWTTRGAPQISFYAGGSFSVSLIPFAKTCANTLDGGSQRRAMQSVAAPVLRTPSGRGQIWQGRRHRSYAKSCSQRFGAWLLTAGPSFRTYLQSPHWPRR